VTTTSLAPTWASPRSVMRFWDRFRSPRDGLADKAERLFGVAHMASVGVLAHFLDRFPSLTLRRSLNERGTELWYFFLTAACVYVALGSLDQHAPAKGVESLSLIPFQRPREDTQADRTPRDRVGDFSGPRRLGPNRPQRITALVYTLGIDCSPHRPLHPATGLVPVTLGPYHSPNHGLAGRETTLGSGGASGLPAARGAQAPDGGHRSELSSQGTPARSSTLFFLSQSNSTEEGI